jgi:hypothetical protein
VATVASEKGSNSTILTRFAETAELDSVCARSHLIQLWARVGQILHVAALGTRLTVYSRNLHLLFLDFISHTLQLLSHNTSSLQLAIANAPDLFASSAVTQLFLFIGKRRS